MNKIPQDPKTKSLKYSFWDGIAASGMTGFTQDYFTPFLLLLGGSAKHVGFLSSLPNLFSALLQLKSPEVTETLKSRKKIINLFVFLQALFLIPLALLAYGRHHQPMVFILTVMFFAGCGAFANPAWGSLMSDLVSEKKRGEYLGWRNKVIGLSTVAMTFVAGFILQSMKGKDIYLGFALLFSFAFVFRLISLYFLNKMFEPPLEYKKEDSFTLVKFLARIKESNFAQFVLFVSLMSFSVNLASPFFAVLMLRDLHFGYLLYTTITITAQVTIYLLMSRWGRHADKVGNLKVIKMTAPIIASLPILWVANRHPMFLFIVQIVSGFAWAGFNLCATNFIYDAVTPSKRTRCIAYFNMLNGLALSLGALVGGFLALHLPAVFGFNLLTLFIISSCLRFFVSLYFPSKLKEVRTVDKVSSYQLFFSVLGIRPLLEADRRPVHYS